MFISLNKKLHGAGGSLIKIHKGTISVVILLFLWEASFIQEIFPEWRKNTKHEVEKLASETHLACFHETCRGNNGWRVNLNVVPDVFNYLSKIISSVGKFLIEAHLLEFSFSHRELVMNCGVSEMAVIYSEASCTQWDIHLICSKTFCCW